MDARLIQLRRILGRLIPYPGIERARRILHAGDIVCPVCEAGVRHLKDSGYGYPVLEKLDVVGGKFRASDRCPVCHSCSRERLIWFFLTDGGSQFRLPADTSIAHFAPEKGLTARLIRAVGSHYTAYDHDPLRYRHHTDVRFADLEALDIASNSTDLVLCNHVLEHLPNPMHGAAEIYRILRQGGMAIMQVPIAMMLTDTLELGPESGREQRISKLGQGDHLRLFSRNGYVDLLRNAGFSVTEYDAFHHDAVKAEDWRLDPQEILYLWCKR